MGIRIVELEPEHLPALVRFSQLTWRRPATLDFCRWRYLEAPGHKAYLALRADGECLAFVSVFSRPYRLGERAVRCLETTDWYCLPELRLSGIGIRLMRRVMEEHAPIVAVGGSADTLALLPRLGWQRLGEATEFALGLGASALRTALGASGLKGGGRVLAGWLARPWPRRDAAPAGCVALAVPAIPDLAPLYAGPLCCNVVPLPVSDQLDWLGREVPGARRFVAVEYRREGALLGWSLLRLGHGQEREAVLLELLAPGAGPALRAWMVARAIAIAADLGAYRIRAQSSCPALSGALLANRFVEHVRWPIQAWRPPSDPLPGPLHFCLNTGDAALLPYPPGTDTTAANA